jgi:hypothetical protein
MCVCPVYGLACAIDSVAASPKKKGGGSSRKMSSAKKVGLGLAGAAAGAAGTAYVAHKIKKKGKKFGKGFGDEGESFFHFFVLNILFSDTMRYLCMTTVTIINFHCTRTSY